MKKKQLIASKVKKKETLSHASHFLGLVVGRHKKIQLHIVLIRPAINSSFKHSSLTNDELKAEGETKITKVRRSLPMSRNGQGYKYK